MAAAFPPALIECIRDARSPVDGEIVLLAAKIWDEGMRFLPGCNGETAIRAALQALAAGLF
jgi:hypothetical protein